MVRGMMNASQDPSEGKAWSETSREVDGCGTCVVRMRTTGRKTLVNARSGRTVGYERQSRPVDGGFDAWLGVSWPAASLRTGLDLERLVVVDQFRHSS